MNPSTKRLMEVKVKRIALNEAEVTTREYWYLRWLKASNDSYEYTYRETNLQRYILNREDGAWKVYQNLRPAPRTTAPQRWRTGK